MKKENDKKLGFKKAKSQKKFLNCKDETKQLQGKNSISQNERHKRAKAAKRAKLFRFRKSVRKAA